MLFLLKLKDQRICYILAALNVDSKVLVILEEGNQAAELSAHLQMSRLLPQQLQVFLIS